MKKTEQTENKTSVLNSNLSKITWNSMQSLNIPIKRQTLVSGLKTYDPTICYLQETPFKYNDKTDWKWKMGRYVMKTLIKWKQE